MCYPFVTGHKPICGFSFFVVSGSRKKSVMPITITRLERANENLVSSREGVKDGLKTNYDKEMRVIDRGGRVIKHINILILYMQYRGYIPSIFL